MYTLTESNLNILTVRSVSSAASRRARDYIYDILAVSKTHVFHACYISYLQIQLGTASHPWGDAAFWLPNSKVSFGAINSAF